jgi:hypothetical protein
VDHDAVPPCTRSTHLFLPLSLKVGDHHKLLSLLLKDETEIAKRMPHEINKDSEDEICGQIAQTYLKMDDIANAIRMVDRVRALEYTVTQERNIFRVKKIKPEMVISHHSHTHTHTHTCVCVCVKYAECDICKGEQATDERKQRDPHSW